MRGFGSDSSQASGEEAKCPVNHKTRELWLHQARAAQSASTSAAPALPQSVQVAPASQPSQPSSYSSSSWSSWLRIPFFSQQSQSANSTQQAQPPKLSAPLLDETRVISSIPRTPDATPSACPVNHEVETGASPTGHWVYPSEKQFFEAMRRKGYDPHAADMKTVVPIHNAVNERAWAEILQWEAPYVEPVSKGGCGGPRLHSFSGLGTQHMSPRARINTLLGYQAPFDRHDWVIDRCGKKIEYVIDFYAGRSDGGNTGKLNFYLDVRPKLNSWEGFKMRALRAVGLS